MKRKYKYIIKFGFYFIVLLAIYISSLCYSNRSVSDDPPQIVLKKSTDMYFRWDEDHVTKVSLKAGDSLSVLAHASGTSPDGKLYWVETRDGRRGLVSQDDADNGMAVINTQAGTMVGDTVKVVRMETPLQAVVKAKDGEEYFFNYTSYNYLTANKMPAYNRKHKLGTIKMSEKHFEEMCTTKTPAELDELWDHAEFVNHTDSGLTIRYQVAVMKKEDGKIYRPVVTFRNDSLTSVSWGTPLASINGWLLRILPGSSIIVDGWHPAIDSFYYSIQFLDPYPWYIYIPGYVLLILIWLIWLFFSFLAIPFLVLALIAMRIPFSFMSNRVLRWFSLGVLFLCAYIWLVLMLVTDHWWFIMIPCLGVIAWLFYLYLDIYLDRRCPHCGTMSDYENINDEITSIGLAKTRSSKMIQTLRRTVTKRIVSNEMIRLDTKDENLYQDFIDTYRVYDHTATIKCNHCGGEWEHYYKTSELINREDDGMHIDTSSSSKFVDD